MPEQQEQTQGLTADDVREVVEQALSDYDEVQSERIDALGVRVDNVGTGVGTLRDSLASVAPAADAVYEVRATSSQVDTAKSALRVLCTEGLVLIVVLSINAGLLGWQAFRGRFVSNG